MMKIIIRSPRHRAAVIAYESALAHFDKVSSGWIPRRRSTINAAQVAINAAYDEIGAAVREADNV